MADPTRTKYIKALDQIVTRFAKLDDTTIRQIIGLLQQVRKDTAAALANNPTDFESFRLGQLRDSIDVMLTDFQSKLNQTLRSSLTDATRLGVAGVAEPLQALGVQAAFNTLVPGLVNVATDYSAALVKNISDDLRQSIDAQLRLATLAQKSPFEAMKDITRALGVRSQDGVWGLRKRPQVVKSVAARAEAIVRTEMTRVYNLANHSTQQQAAEVVPGLRKRWIATADGRTRPTHLEAHRATLDNPIPIDQPFRVGRDELMYPGDPRGSAKETVHCRCSMANVLPEVGVIQTPLDQKISQVLDRRKDEPA